jgi:thioredoxin-like negative regulator of GroEL
MLCDGCFSGSPNAERDWLDELVELHVLAASGDTAAALAAERRMAADPAFRQAWTEVEDTCDRVRLPGR